MQGEGGERLIHAGGGETDPCKGRGDWSMQGEGETDPCRGRRLIHAGGGGD